MPRALRRHHLERIKKRVEDYFGGFAKDEPNKKRFVGRWANTRTPCSCWMCGNARRYFGKRSFQEIKQDLKFADYDQEKQSWN